MSRCQGYCRQIKDSSHLQNTRVLIEKINLFKKPMANYHIPQNTILKFRFYFKFLVANNRDIAKEIKDHYIDTMGKVTFSYFKSYSGRLLKLQYDELPTSEDLLGV